MAQDRNALITQRSIEQCNRLLCSDLVLDDSFAGSIVKVEMGLLKNGITEAPVVLSGFNELLASATKLECVPEGDRGRCRIILQKAVTQFVKIQHAHLLFEKKKFSDTDVGGLAESTAQLGVALIKTAFDYCLLENTANLTNLSLEIKNDFSSMTFAAKSFFERVGNFFKGLFGVDEETKNFHASITQIIDKLERYSIDIGKSVQIAEMIRDYAQWAYDYERKITPKPNYVEIWGIVVIVFGIILLILSPFALASIWAKASWLIWMGRLWWIDICLGLVSGLAGSIIANYKAHAPERALSRRREIARLYDV